MASPVNNQMPTTSKFQGWSIQGIRHFNELYDLVAKEQSMDTGADIEKEFSDILYCFGGI